LGVVKKEPGPEWGKKIPAIKKKRGSGTGEEWGEGQERHGKVPRSPGRHHRRKRREKKREKKRSKNPDRRGDVKENDFKKKNPERGDVRKKMERNPNEGEWDGRNPAKTESIMWVRWIRSQVSKKGFYPVVGGCCNRKNESDQQSSWKKRVKGGGGGSTRKGAGFVRTSMWTTSRGNRK